MIRTKIDEQQDKGARTLRAIKAYKLNIKIDMTVKLEKIDSYVKLYSTDDQGKEIKTSTEALKQEIKRYLLLINSNKEDTNA